MQWLIDLVLESLTGIIVAWSGPLANVPKGWQLCDGTNLTPDLRARFIYGITNEGQLHDTGGTSAHVHDVVGDNHSHNFISGPGGWVTGTDKRDDRTEVTGITGETLLGTFLPPYYRLAYIMKMKE